jgi:uncharacterized membrane protein YbhN (UPF0104 family)
MAGTTIEPLSSSKRRTSRLAAVRSGLADRVGRATDALLTHAQPTAAGDAALAGRPVPMRLPRPSRRQVAIGGTLVAVALAVLTVTGGPMAELTQAFDRALGADWGWVAAGVGFEAASFAGYILLFWLICGRVSSTIGIRESAEISLSGAAATRLLPTGGLGGIALTLWALARSGMNPREAVGSLLTFLVLLYSVFMTALAVAGGLLVLGVAPGDGPVALAALPALFALFVIVTVSRLGIGGSTALGTAARGGVAYVRRADPRLLGAVAWWGFDLAVLFATFQALGEPPAAPVLILAYFTGAIANTIPLPGLVAGSTTGVLLAFGIDASLALPAVLAYRAVALWLPAVLGTAAMAGLRSTVAKWGREADADIPLPASVPAPSPQGEQRFVRTPACCGA